MPTLGPISGATGGGTPSSMIVGALATRATMSMPRSRHSLPGPLVSRAVDAVDDHRPDQHRLPVAWPAGDDVDAVVHAVDEVDVQVGRPGRTSLRCASCDPERCGSPGRRELYASTSMIRPSCPPTTNTCSSRSGATSVESSREERCGSRASTPRRSVALRPSRAVPQRNRTI